MYELGQDRNVAAISTSNCVRFLLFMSYNQKYMNLAIKEAIKALNEDEVPVGCVIIKDGKVLASAHNKKVKKQDATAHSEIECIHKASKKIQSWYLNDCEMYVTLEPCMMCTGAIVNARIKKIYYAAKDIKGGCMQSCLEIKTIKNLNHYPEYEFKEDRYYISLLKEFFKNKRKKLTN